MNFFLWLEWLIRFGALALFLLCLAKYRADCPMNEICCDSNIFTIYQNETGFVKRSKVSVKANGSAGFAICFIGFSAQN